MTERAEKKRRSQQAFARAAMLLRRDLGWVSGFPLTRSVAPQASRDRPSQNRDSILWCTVPWASTGSIALQALDRDSIRSAELAASRLRNQFPTASRKLFGKPDEWFDRIDCVLRAVKSVIHHGASSESIWDVFNGPECPRRERQNWESLDRSFSNSKPFIRSVRFLNHLNPQGDTRRLQKWLEQSSASLDLLGTETAVESPNDCGESLTKELGQPLIWQLKLACCRESIRDPNDLWNVVCLLRSPAFHHLHYPDPCKTVIDHAKQLRKAFDRQSISSLESQPEQGSPQTCLPHVLQSLDLALESKERSRREVISFLSAVGASNVVFELDRLHEEIESEQRRLNKVHAKLCGALSVRINWRSRECKSEREKVAETTKFSESAVRTAKALGQCLEKVTQVEPSVRTAASRWIVATASQPDAGFGFLTEAIRTISYGPSGPGKRSALRAGAELLNELAGVFRRNERQSDLADLLVSCSSASSSFYRMRLFGPWLNQETAANLAKRRPAITLPPVSSLARLLEQTFCGERESWLLSACSPIIASFQELLIAGLSVSEASQTIRHLHRKKLPYRLSADEVGAVLPFAEDACDLATLLVHFKRSWFCDESTQQLHPLATDRIAKQHVRRLIQNEKPGDLNSLSSYCKAFTVFCKGQQLAPIQSGDASWVLLYPKPLHEQLERLNNASVEAHSIARHVLRHDFADIEKHKSEMTYLSGQLRGNGLSAQKRACFGRRCEVLIRQILYPTPVSSCRLDRLNQKLAKRADLELQRRIIDSLVVPIQDGLQAFGISSAKWLMNDSTKRKVLLGVADLDRTMREIGLWLFSRIENGLPCPGLEEQANRSYVDRIASRGIDPSPWLDNSRSLKVSPKNGAPFTLRFSQDVMDYFLMGHHFSTCLSPDDVNFFSTISNAVDINKQVLYGRSDDGKVVGRCLLVLGSKGELLTFRCYSHQSGNDFFEAVAQFVHELSSEMGTTQSTTAEVPNLVATSWYDDGAICTIGDRHRNYRREFELSLAGIVGKADADPDRLDELAKAAANLITHRSVEHLLDQLPPAPATIAPSVLDVLWRALVEGVATPEQRLKLAIWASRAGHLTWIDQALNHFSRQTLIHVFRRARCANVGCDCFHRLGDNEQVRKVLDRVAPADALAVLRGTRRRKIRSDLEETSRDRRELLALAHQRLGRKNLPNRLRESGPR